MRGAELTFLCNGVDGISPPLFDYYIYMVDEQGWRNCDVTTAGGWCAFATDCSSIFHGILQIGSDRSPQISGLPIPFMLHF